MSQSAEPTDEHYQLFGQLLVSWRDQRGMTQQGAARRPGAPSDTTLAAIEAGTWRSRNPNPTLRKVDAAMGWPPGIARAFLFEARVEELRDPVFVKDIFADLDSVAPDVDYTHGIGGVPVDISLGTAAHDAAVQRVASVLPALRLADLAAVAMVIRSMLTARDGRAPAFVEQLDEVIHGLPRVDPGSEDAIHLSAATGRMSWLLSAQDRIAGRDRVVEKLAAAHEEAHTIEDEQLGDDTP